MFKKQLQILLLTFLVHAGVYGQSYALDFDGTNDYVTTPIDADLQAMPSTTWSGWIKPTGVSGWQIIFGMEDGGWDRMLLIEPGGGLSLGHTNNRWQTGISIATGAWQHVAVVYDNGAMRFYYNGIAYATTTTEGNHSSAGTFTIGGNQSPGGNYYRGLIDEVAVWNEALTAAEITTLYNSGIGLDAASNSGNYASASNLVGYYKMNEGTGTTIADASSNSNTGTLANMDAAAWVTGYNLKPLPTITNFNPYTKTYFDGSFIIINPTSNSTGAFSYASDNAAVATISGNTVTITGIGTANITATQAEDATYSSGTATVSLTVSGINLVSKYGGISPTNPNYVDRHGKIGGATGISSNGERVLVKSHELSGLTSATASSSAYAIKQLYPSSTDGLYWIANSNINGGTPFQIYADMTAGGGGWMLLNASGGRVASVQANTVTASTLDSRTYLPNPIVVELAKIATTVQLRSGPIANKTANIATSSDNKPIIALRTGANWYSNNAYLSFITTAGSPYTWGNRGSAGVANGWPSMFHGPCGPCVHWLALHSMGDGAGWNTGEWFSTWIR